MFAGARLTLSSFMATLTEIQNCLINGSEKSEIAPALNTLGTLLREETIRADPLLDGIIPHLLTLYKVEPGQVIRVLVNYTADNDGNRKYLASQEQCVLDFWTSALSSLDDNALGLHTVVLLTQFIHNIDDDKKKSMVIALLDHNVVLKLLDYCRKCLQNGNADNLSMPFELFSEYSVTDPRTFTVDDLVWVIEASSRVIDECDKEDCDEILLYASQTALNITNVDNWNELTTKQYSLIQSVYHLMNKVPSDLENVAHIKRNLFSTCGNVSSYPQYDNLLDLAMNAAHIMNETSDLYVAAALAILIGNCVSSRDTQTLVITRLGESCSFDLIIEAVLHRQFGDVVQYQALHFFNNLLTDEAADVILREHNLSDLARITKVVIDNGKYYKEIGGIFYKFMRKLILTGFTGHRDVFVYNAVWNYLDTAESDPQKSEVEMLLLQVIATTPASRGQWAKNADLVHRLLAETMSVGGTIDGTLMLTKLKILAVVFRSYPSTELEASLGPERFVENFASPFYELMVQLSQSPSHSTLNRTEPNAQIEPGLHTQNEPGLQAANQQAAVANNTKYVAAIAAEYFALLGNKHPLYLQIVAVCSAAVRQ